MSDITCCQGEWCPMKEKCYRYTARKDEYMQTYFTEPPIKDWQCEYFWDTEDKKSVDLF